MKKPFYIPVLLLLFILLPSLSLSECIEGDCQNGKGTYTYSDGSKYAGEWKNNKKHGQGTYTSAYGYKYEGAWMKGMRQGLGKVIDEKGVVSKNGYWKNGSFKGGKF